MIGLAVGVITSVATEPLDVVKTRIIGQKRRVARASLPGAAAHAAGGGQGRIRPTIARAQRRRHETCKPSQRGEGETPPLVPPKALQAPQDFGYTGMIHGLRQIVSTEGVASLWRGLLPRLLLKALGSMIWYPVYMSVLRLAA